jgi:hypothetical protein
MVYTLGDNVDTMVDNQRTMLPEQVQEKREHTHGRNLWRLPHGDKPQSLAHDYDLQCRIPPEGWTIWGL